MSKRNETINRIYQASPLRTLPAIQRKALRQAIENAYDAGRTHPPTHEQIEEAIGAVAEAHAPGRDWDTEVMYPDDAWDALVALHALFQNGADR